MRAVRKIQLILKQNKKRFGLPYAQKVLTLGSYYQTDEITTQAPTLFSLSTLSRPDIDLQLTTLINKSDNDPESGSIAQTHITNNYSNYIQIYTDGSKNDEHKLAGAAYVVYNTQNAVIHHSKVKYTKHLTIFTCELAIINSALTWLNELETHELFNYVIISDSLKSVKSRYIQNAT